MDNYVVIGTKLDTSDFDRQIEHLEKYLKDLEEDYNNISNSKPFEGQEEQLKKMSGEILSTKKQLQSLQKQKEAFQQKGFKNIFDGLNNKAKELGNELKDVSQNSLKGLSKKVDNVGKSIQGVTKKILKWGLALFGIRAIYGFIRQAVSTVVQYNEGLGNQINFMKAVMATSLEPIIKRIISLVYTLFSFVNSIVAKLTGKNLFEQAKKNMQSGAKSAKEMKKQLAGFDEMNVLQDNKQASSGFDSSGFVDENSKLLDILNKFKEMFVAGDWAGIARTISNGIINGLTYLTEKIKSIDWSGIGSAISEFLTNLDFSGMLVALVSVFGEALLGFQNLILAIDWGKLFSNLSKGIADAIFKIDDYIKKIKWSQLGKALSDAFTSTDWAGIGNSILTTLWDTLAGIGNLFLSVNWEEVGSTVGDAVIQWIETIITKFKETDWGKLGSDIVDAIFDFIEGIDWVKLGTDIIAGLILGIMGMIEFVVGAFKTLLEKILAFFGIHSPSTVFADVGKNIMLGLINGLKSLTNAVVSVFSTIVNKIKSVFSNVVSWINTKVINPIINLFKSIGTKVGNVIGASFKSVINSVLRSVQNILNSPINAINKLIGKVRKVPGLGGLKTLNTLRFPRLAKGGIINMPGRGVPVGGVSAIAGERGQEAVVPLTDSQQMALLGEAIGKYIRIDNVIDINMDSRKINRILQSSSDRTNFAMNR